VFSGSGGARRRNGGGREVGDYRVFKGVEMTYFFYFSQNGSIYLQFQIFNLFWAGCQVKVVGVTL
jgi:hypothetical protein